MKITAPCLFGVESVLSFEAKRLNFKNVETTDGKVSFIGDYYDLAKANVNFRTAERVCIVLAEFTARTFEELFQGVYKCPLEMYIGKNDAFPVKGSCLSSKLESVPSCQAIIKKAAAKRLGEKYKLNWLEETGPLHQLQFTIIKDKVTLLLDTSGISLHKRGYRPEANTAPIRETLAAGICDLARVREGYTLIDPCCGSGTLLIEGVQKALHMAPGMYRRYNCETWSQMPKDAFTKAREEAKADIKWSATFNAYGYDIDPLSSSLVHSNASRAHVDKYIKVKQADIGTFIPPEEKFILLANPPYGERMADIKEAERIVKLMGQRFIPGEDRTYAIISPLENFEQVYGRPATKKRKLYNGMIKCNLYIYF